MWVLAHSICSPARVVGYSPTNCSDIELLAQSKSKHIPEKFCLQGSLTEAYLHSLSGMTLPPLESTIQTPKTTLSGCEKGAGNSSFVAGSRSYVKTSVQPEKALESTENAQGCGEKWHGSLAKYDPDSSSWKTAQCLLLGGLEEFSETWSRWGLMRNGVVYPLESVALGMRETEFGYLLPTPNTKGLDGGSNSRRSNKRRMMPTPKKQDMRHATTRHITATDKHWESNLGEVLTALTGLKKWSPNFVEWLMGWPIDHTGLQPLEMGKFRLWLQQHGECLEGQ